MAQKSREQTGVVLLRLLERRLDNVVYRLGLARTRPQARQFLTHGLVRVNGERVEAGQPFPGWLERRDGGGVILREPRREEIDPDIVEQRIVEFYSR
jgi:small subunit ribosomal protein S4